MGCRGLPCPAAQAPVAEPCLDHVVPCWSARGFVAPCLASFAADYKRIVSTGWGWCQVLSSGWAGTRSSQGWGRGSCVPHGSWRGTKRTRYITYKQSSLSPFSCLKVKDKPTVGVYLSGTDVTDAGLKDLAGLKQLQWLNLTKTQVTDAGLKHLAGLKQLRLLLLTNTKVTDKGIADLKKALPNLVIE